MGRGNSTYIFQHRNSPFVSGSTVGRTSGNDSTLYSLSISFVGCDPQQASTPDLPLLALPPRKLLKALLRCTA